MTCYQIDLFFIRKLCKKNLAWTTKWYLGRVWLLNGVLVVNVWEKSKEKKVMMGFQGLSGGYWKEKTKVFIKELPKFSSKSYGGRMLGNTRKCEWYVSQDGRKGWKNSKNTLEESRGWGPEDKTFWWWWNVSV